VVSLKYPYLNSSIKVKYPYLWSSCVRGQEAGVDDPGISEQRTKSRRRSAKIEQKQERELS
jgi:hypothetical protein